MSSFPILLATISGYASLQSPNIDNRKGCAWQSLHHVIRRNVHAERTDRMRTYAESKLPQVILACINSPTKVITVSYSVRRGAYPIAVNTPSWHGRGCRRHSAFSFQWWRLCSCNDLLEQYLSGGAGILPPLL